MILAKITLVRVKVTLVTIFFILPCYTYWFDHKILLVLVCYKNKKVCYN